MAVAATRGSRKKHLLPNSLEHGLKLGALKTLGATLVLAALLSWASLLSWSVDDPSLNHATNGSTTNFLGKGGAVFSDILIQGFGIAAIFLILPLAIEGMRLLLSKPSYKIRLRALSTPFSAALFSTTLSLLPKITSWPLSQGYGGIIGDTISGSTNIHAIAQSSNLSLTLTFCILFILTLIAFSFTTNLTWKEARVLFHIEDKEAFKASLRAPFNRLGYWFRFRQASQVEPSYNQRQWWRNANLDETEGAPLSLHPEHQGQPRIYPQNTAQQLKGQQQGDNHTPLSMRPHTPADFRNEGISSNKGISSPELPPVDLPPMSAKAEPYRAQHLETKTAKKSSQRTNKHGMGKQSEDFVLPPVTLLNEASAQPAAQLSHEELREMAVTLEGVLLDFGIKGSILNVRPGPVVTLFEFEPARGIKTSRIVGLADDIARSMSALSARIAVIPGRSALGIELPNATSETVFLRDLVEQPEFYHTELPLPLILGKSIGGEPVITDLSTMPHLLIAGTTGSGKSVGINTMLLSLLYRLTPEECRMIMIDPKMLELSIYDGIPHLLTPVVTDPSKAVSALKWAVREMEDRYRQMSKLGVRNIEGFNERVKEAINKNEPIIRKVQTGFDQQTGRAIFEEEQLDFKPIPMIVVVIDEMADLMMVAGKEIEATVQRLAQMARAAGIHVVMATQRPSVDVITGTIKANFPSRISFQVTSKIDSRTILGKEGAEQLLGRGDMLYMPNGSRMVRVHGAFVNDDEVENVVAHLRSQGTPEYLDNITVDEEQLAGDETQQGAGKKKDIFHEAVEIVIRDQKASISYLQRRLSIGYNRAATLVERMEEEGIISPPGAGGKREILIDEY
ncbi:DNA translocase FtsK [Hyphomicrobiales bacterium 4NK60-0047b]|jgi:S-DNA-T family DNA segregation ATPase FtsK/SpoIIIE